MDNEAVPLEPVEPGYRHALRLRLAVAWLVATVIATIVGQTLLEETAFKHLLPAVVLLIAIAVVAVAPARIYRRLRFRQTDRLLQVVRGWLFHTDTIVPLVRVQHLDVTRGPFDKLFGTASLVVHTAGTHNSVVILPGLSPDRAAAMRDAIREHVRSDFA